MKAIKTLSDQEIIAGYLSHPEGATPLTSKQQELLERYSHCADLIKKYGSRLKVTRMLMKMYQIDQATAYRCFEDTQMIFGTTSKSTQNFWIDIVMGMMIETRQKAYDEKDLKTAAAVERNMIKTIKDFMGDNSAIDWAKIQPPRITIGFFPELLNNPLPDDFEEQLKVLMKVKKKSLKFDPYEDLTDPDKTE